MRLPNMVAAFALSLLLVTAAGSQERDRALAFEDTYREALADLAAGFLGLAVSRIVVLKAESSIECVAAIEHRTAELLAELEPESLVPQAFLRLAVHRDQYETRSQTAGLFRFERVSINSLRELGDLYLETSQDSNAPSVVAGMLTYQAQVVAATRSTERLDTTRFLLEAAAELDPTHLAALHSLAVNLELRGRYALALRHLEKLVALEPEDPRYRVRRAMVTVKSGRLKRGRLLLEELTTEGSIWARDLATQELARLLSASGRQDEAEALLRGALRELPSEKLSLQLAALLDPRWTDSWEVLGAWLAVSHRASGPSARWVYEYGAKEELEALRMALGSAVDDRSARLGTALSRLPRLNERGRLEACR